MTNKVEPVDEQHARLMGMAERMEELETSIEKGQIEAKRVVWNAMYRSCYLHYADCKCGETMEGCYYDGCPLLKGVR